MEKKRAEKIISDAASIYEEKFRAKNLLIVYGNCNSPFFIQTRAAEENFLHLTGAVINSKKLLRDTADKNANPLTLFYQKALYHKLSVDDFDFKKDGTTEQKLEVLINTLKLNRNAKMFGDYLNGHLKLKTDKITGSVNSYLGFLKVGKYYVPNTVMSEDIRKSTKKAERVLAILSKKITEKEYNTVEMVAKDIDIHRLLQKISNSVNIDASLITPVAEKQTIAEVTKEIDKPIVTSAPTKVPAPQPVPQKQSLKSLMAKAAQQKKEMAAETKPIQQNRKNDIHR